MLKLTDLTLRRGPRVLFGQVSLTINQSDRVGLTGANGSGKSSLFSMILGELSADSGEYFMPANLEISHVAQETPAVNMSAIDYVMDGDRELRRVQDDLSQAEQADDGLLQANLHGQLDAIGGYTAHSRASRLMHGLGFVPGQETRLVNSFSGGWRMRLNLAQALMCRSDVLLLDEPTNHLDLDAVIWLQDWLKAYQGTLLLISHDREFLDGIVTHIAHVEHGDIKLYTGHYSDFERQRAMQLAQQQAAYEKQQRELLHMQDFVRRFRAKASKAKQAQSRLKAMERMEIIAQAHVDSPFYFAFAEPDVLPNTLLSLEEVEVGYGETVLLSGLKLSLEAGDRIGLIGPNGAGKSTLVKLIAGQQPLLFGERKTAKGLHIGYFAQHQLEQLVADASPVWHIQQLDKKASEQSIRDFLGGFGFHDQRVFEPIAPLSGGEKARLVLAMLVYQKPNLLLLDEPTNHLDIEMRHALNMALQDFTGAMVLVSHDRHLLRSVTDKLILVSDGTIHDFSGDLDEYRQWLLNGERRSVSESSIGRPEKNKDFQQNQRQVGTANRQNLKSLKKVASRLEEKLAKQHAEQQSLDQRLANNELYTADRVDELQVVIAEKKALDKQVQETEEAWLLAEEALEAVANN